MLTPEAVEVVREAFWIAIIWVISHESHFVHIRPKTIAVRLAKLVIQEVRDGAQDPEKVSVSVLRVLRAERLSDPQADTREATISFRDDNSSNSHLSGSFQLPLRERFAGPGARDESGKVVPLDLKAGDRVLFGKWSGTEVKGDGEDLLIMKESDIMGVIEGAPALKKKTA